MKILFLQGLASPFFSRLAAALRDDGCTIHKIFFCGGDVLFWRLWRGCRCHFYRGRMAALEGYYDAFFSRHAIDAVVLFGDGRPVHAPAIRLCRARGIPVFVFEEGYLRPHWITMDRDGANAASSLPRDPEFYRHEACPAPVPDEALAPVGGGLGARIAMDVLFNAGNLAMLSVFPRYRTHRPHIVWLEYAGFIRRFIRNAVRRRSYGRLYERIFQDSAPFYFLPMQLDSDYQLRLHSPLARMEDVILHAAESFARHAPGDSRLVVKLHPLDNGLKDYRRICRGIVARCGLEGRLVFIEGGSTPRLLRACRGVVTVNSTVGLSAVLRGLKVKTLGRALYDMDGLTWQGGIDDFWTADFVPDAGLWARFRSVMIEKTQINGSFFTRRGITLGAAEAARRIRSGLAAAGPGKK